MKRMMITRNINTYKYSLMNINMSPSPFFNYVIFDINNSINRSSLWEGIIDILIIKEINSHFKDIIISLIKL